MHHNYTKPNYYLRFLVPSCSQAIEPWLQPLEFTNKRCLTSIFIRWLVDRKCSDFESPAVCDELLLLDVLACKYRTVKLWG